MGRLICWLTAHHWGNRVELSWHEGWRQCRRCGKRQSVSGRWVGTFAYLCPDEMERL